MRLTVLDLQLVDAAALDAVLRRSAVPDPDVRRAAADIVSGVRQHGDAAVVDASARFGGGLAGGALRVPPAHIRAAWEGASPALRKALENAATAVRRAHEPQRPVDHPLEVIRGVRVDRRWHPLRRVGVYVPGGRAPYPSSLVMGVVPAQVAGVAEIVVTTPADPDGQIAEALLAAAALLGVDEVYAVGGAQAVAALAYGTETIGRVEKIVGPGNVWVTAAKLAVFGDCAIDLPAGPSESLVIADAAADARVVAADLLCQAEHGPDSPVLLVTTSPQLGAEVEVEIDRLLPRLARSAILEKSLGDHGMLVLAPTHDAAIDFANAYAPEHLSIHTIDAAGDAERLTAAGSVFVGHWSPESAGDYATGANHVLPTGGLAAAYGPLSVEDFGSWRQVQELTQGGLATLRPTIVSLAEAEGLTAHRLAADIRFEEVP